MFYVYILENYDKAWRYTGYTSDLKRRVKEHFSGQSASTKPYLPVQLVFYEAYSNEEDARRREHYLKTTQGKQALKRMLRSHYEEKSSRIKQGTTT